MIQSGSNLKGLGDTNSGKISTFQNFVKYRGK